MNFEELLALNPNTWPLAIMAFLRIVTVFFFLPILGDKVIPSQFRIATAVVVTICLWPAIESSVRTTGNILQWSPVTLALATFREALFGFATAFSARMLIFATSIGSHLVGVNMGFQTATLFSQTTNTEESSYSVLQGWIIIILILVLNMHHVFFKGIANSFYTIPIATSASAATLAHSAGAIVTTAFVLGIKLCAPILIIQVLINISLGCLARAVPQLNVFVLSFPISFVVSMVLLFFSAGMYVRYLSNQGMQSQANSFSLMQHVFSSSNGGNTK